MNAAGWCKETQHVKTLARSGVDAITVGSIMWEKRAGNASELQGYPFGFDHDTENSTNWLGLPGPGAKEYYRTHLKEMVTIAHDAGKCLRVNIVGFTPNETVQLTLLCLECGVDEIECNWGCPNTTDTNAGKMTNDPVSYLPDLMFAHADALRSEVGTGHNLGVKLSPTPVSAIREAAASIINTTGIFNFVVLCNTLPDVVLFDEHGKPFIRENNGKGGLGGKIMLSVAIGQILLWRPLLESHIEIVGCGGVFTGLDLWQYVSRKVRRVQVGSAFIGTENPAVFSDIADGFAELESS